MINKSNFKPTFWNFNHLYGTALGNQCGPVTDTPYCNNLAFSIVTIWAYMDLHRVPKQKRINGTPL